MSTADHIVSDRPVSDIAAELAAAEFVQFVTSPEGDALAATGLLARLLSIPFQARIRREGAVDSVDTGVTVAVGNVDSEGDGDRDDSDGDVDLRITDRPLSVRAIEIARTLAEDEDAAASFDPELRALALAGIIAAEREIDVHTDVFERSSGIDRRPGVGIPTADPIDGLAHTTLVHAPFSGDVEATAEALSDIDDDDEPRVRIASMLAVSVVETAGTHASTAIERVLSPHVVEPGDSSPFATLAGYADVLDALARSAPGVGLALALGHDNAETALACWREHARTVHAAVHSADIDRYSDCVVARLSDTPLSVIEPAARLIREYLSPEPVVLATTDEGAVATTRTRARDMTKPLADAVSAAGSEATVMGCDRYARTTIEPEGAFVAAFREAI